MRINLHLVPVRDFDELNWGIFRHGRGVRIIEGKNNNKRVSPVVCARRTVSLWPGENRRKKKKSYFFFFFCRYYSLPTPSSFGIDNNLYLYRRRRRDRAPRALGRRERLAIVFIQEPRSRKKCECAREQVNAARTDGRTPPGAITRTENNRKIYERYKGVAIGERKK